MKKSKKKKITFILILTSFFLLISLSFISPSLLQGSFPAVTKTIYHDIDLVAGDIKCFQDELTNTEKHPVTITNINHIVTNESGEIILEGLTITVHKAIPSNSGFIQGDLLEPHITLIIIPAGGTFSFYICYTTHVALKPDTYNIKTDFVIEKTEDDDTPPATTHSLSGTLGNNNWYISNVNVMLTALDDSSGVNKTFYRLDSGLWQTYTNTFTISSDGTHVIDYYSTDMLGNRENTKSVTVKIDKTASSASIIKPEKGFLYIRDKKITYIGQTIVIGRITVKVSTSDMVSGITKVDFYVDNKLKSTDTTAPYKWKWNEKSYCKHQLKTITYDQAGNKKSAEMDVWIFRWW